MTQNFDMCNYEINQVIIPKQALMPDGLSNDRGKDNFINSKDYIINQLFVLNYNNSDDFDWLKTKLWVLDGPVRKTEYIYIDELTHDGEVYYLCEYTDTDIENPVNHWGILQNDLIYLDRYIRTEDDLLETDPPEMNFDELWESRNSMKERFINTIKHECEDGSDIYFQDWEQSYLSRPTLLNKEDFIDLYNAYKTKEINGELENAYDITKKVTTYTIDHEIDNTEMMVNNDVPASETEAQLLISAENEANKNDINYVKQLQEIHDEIVGILQYLINDLIDDVEETEEELDTEDTTVSSSSIIAVNACEKREQIVLIKDHASHKGMIIDQETIEFCAEELSGTGGYRYRYRSPENNYQNIENIYDTETVCDIHASIEDTAILNLYNEVESGWDNIVLYVSTTTSSSEEEETTTTTTEEEEEETTTITTKDINDLPSGGTSKGTVSIERFNILNDRWININSLREDQIMNMGTRGIIESMINADIPELGNDKENHMNDKKDQKSNYIIILKENRGEFS